ncbi:MAG TPA: hypothetical protein VJ417_09210, partial [Candidatus Glassbacteria bacterium]|nr:hypothetical protein [Candidatus Glassbacteria bacterium]
RCGGAAVAGISIDGVHSLASAASTAHGGRALRGRTMKSNGRELTQWWEAGSADLRYSGRLAQTLAVEGLRSRAARGL